MSLPTLFSGFAGAEIVNAGKSEFYGFETNVTAQFDDQWRAYATLGLLATKFKDFPFAVDESGSPVNAADPSLANLSGNEFRYAPDLEVSAGVSWEHPREFFASGNVHYTTEQHGDVAKYAVNKGDEGVPECH